MPLGEIVGEVILRPIMEVVVCGLSYVTGYLVLKLVTLGNIDLAPLARLHERRGGKKKWYQVDWGLWIDASKSRKLLKAEWTCTVGIVILVAVGVAIYMRSR